MRRSTLRTGALLTIVLTGTAPAFGIPITQDSAGEPTLKISQNGVETAAAAAVSAFFPSVGPTIAALLLQVAAMIDVIAAIESQSQQQQDPEAGQAEFWDIGIQKLQATDQYRELLDGLGLGGGNCLWCLTTSSSGGMAFDIANVPDDAALARNSLMLAGNVQMGQLQLRGTGTFSIECAAPIAGVDHAECGAAFHILPVGAATQLPEPSTLALLATGFVLLGAIRRRRVLRDLQ